MDQLAEYRAWQRQRFAEQQRRRLQEHDGPARGSAWLAGSSRSLENEVIKELNSARTKPFAYANLMRKRLRQPLWNEVCTEAFEEAVEFLKRHPPLTALREENVRMLRLAADDHRADLASHAADGHLGSDGSSSANRVSQYGQRFGAVAQALWFGRVGASATDIVQDLIIDEVAPSRSNRFRLFDASLAQVGVAHGPHSNFGACAVLVFAEGCLEDGIKAALREMRGPQQAYANISSTPSDVREPFNAYAQVALECHGVSVQDVQDSDLGIDASRASWQHTAFASSSCGASLLNVPSQEGDGKPHCLLCTGRESTVHSEPVSRLPQPRSTSACAGRRVRKGGGVALRAVSAARACRSTGGLAPAAAWPGHLGGSPSREQRHNGSSSRYCTPRATGTGRRCQIAVGLMELVPSGGS